jgi:glycosyltransferase involved in cell wall biosynthesis
MVIPSYNNAPALEQVLRNVARYAAHVIVVNDGSTDQTASILASLQAHFMSGIRLEAIHLPVNSGKGKALQEGFKRAVDSGCCYALTIDSDGQHFAEDIPAFAEALQKNPGSLIVGARNMQQDGVPGKSSLGNRFSNFWYRLETGITLPDTQSGFRLYPVERMRNMHFFTSGYEFEVESLVRAAWMDCRILWIPISVYYAPEGSRISHFRPFRDFMRISVLNTVLVLIAVLWIKPRKLMHRLYYDYPSNS